MKSLLLEELSWVEIKKAIEDGYKTVIIGGGSTEQHGPHLPEGTDHFLATAIAEGIAKELGKTLVAPSIRPALSEHHMSFPGTITLRPSTFLAVLEDYVDSYVRHGFENIILFPAHGGNAQMMEHFANESSRYYAGAKIKVVCCISSEVKGIISALNVKEDGVSPEVTGIHAGEGETSMGLAVYSDLIDMSLADCGFVGDMNEVRNTLYAVGMHGVTKNGILGDARNASAERGRKLNDRYAKACADYTRKQLGW